MALGYLTVTAEGLVGLADSADSGGDPDYIPLVGTVTLAPSISRPLRIESTDELLLVSTIATTFDSNGVLAYDGITDVRIIAPQWTDLSDTTWSWNATIAPGPGQTWQAFTVNFTGEPGDTINLASLIS